MKKQLVYKIDVSSKDYEKAYKQAEAADADGADSLWIYNYSTVEEEHEELLAFVKKVVKELDVVCYIGCHVSRFEDIKKAFYTGAKAVVISQADSLNESVVAEGVKRFGAERIAVTYKFHDSANINELSSIDSFRERLFSTGAGRVFLQNIINVDDITDMTSGNTIETKDQKSVCLYVQVQDKNVSESVLSSDLADALLVSEEYLGSEKIYEYKEELSSKNIDVSVFKDVIPFADLKKDSNGLVPVVVQDYMTNEVLMVAYMNEESYNLTVKTGRMTYYSRSRKELWLKGETSGHFQYVKSLTLDCDSDTILAKVRQIGAACHTGNRSCFFTDIVKKETLSKNPLLILNEVYDTIADRKVNPKEGSYTNYLFDKGIDKILKKCGEEATEIVIAAKNPESEEIKYEIADFLYHMMVLMVEKGVDWEDITAELANRH